MQYLFVCSHILVMHTAKQGCAPPEEIKWWWKEFRRLPARCFLRVFAFADKGATCSRVVWCVAINASGEVDGKQSCDRGHQRVAHQARVIKLRFLGGVRVSPMNMDSLQQQRRRRRRQTGVTRLLQVTSRFTQHQSANYTHQNLPQPHPVNYEKCEQSFAETRNGVITTNILLSVYLFTPSLKLINTNYRKKFPY